MRGVATILCPGPSLARVRRSDVLGARIAVNRACEFAVCDWWAAGDSVALESFRPVGLPRLFAGDSATTHTPPHILGRFDVRRWDDPTLKTPDADWRWFTVTAAIVLAVNLGAVDVRILGADMRGVADFTGHIDPEHNRGDGRWSNEAGLLREVTAWAANEGAVVRRITTP